MASSCCFVSLGYFSGGFSLVQISYLLQV